MRPHTRCASGVRVGRFGEEADEGLDGARVDDCLDALGRRGRWRRRGETARSAGCSCAKGPRGLSAAEVADGQCGCAQRAQARGEVHAMIGFTGIQQMYVSEITISLECNP